MHGFDVENETLAALETLRQGGNHAGKFDVAGFPGRRQFVGQSPLRPPSGPGKTEQQASEQRPEERHGQFPLKHQQQSPHSTQPEQKRQSQQLRLHLQKQNTEREGGDEAHHLVFMASAAPDEKNFP